MEKTGLELSPSLDYFITLERRQVNWLRSLINVAFNRRPQYQALSFVAETEKVPKRFTFVPLG